MTIKIDSEKQIMPLLRRMWKTAKIDDYEIAEILGITGKSVSNKVRGTTHFTVAEMMQIIHHLGLELYLMGGSNGKHK